MDPLSLEPCALQQRWTLAEATPPAGWACLFADYVEAVARACAAAGPCVIGHIKALALVPPGGYVRLSVLAADRPAEVELGGGAANPAAAALTLTLNVHVYGLPGPVVAECASQAALEVSQHWGATVRPVRTRPIERKAVLAG